MMARRWTKLMALALALAAAAACSYDEASRVDASDRWAVRMDEADPIQISGYDLVILDPDRSPQLDAIRYAAPKMTLIARLPMAEAELGSKAWRRAHDEGYLLDPLDARLSGESSELRAIYALDVRRTAWRLDLRARIARLIARGYDGVYFDGIAHAVEREWGDVARWEGTRAALAHEVHWARHAHPEAVILLDAERSLSGELPDVDGVVARGVYGRWDALRRAHADARPQEERERLLRYLEDLRRDYEVPIFVVDYIDAHKPWRFAEACVELRERGFTPYMAPPEGLGAERWSCL